MSDNLKKEIHILDKIRMNVLDEDPSHYGTLYTGINGFFNIEEQKYNAFRNAYMNVIEEIIPPPYDYQDMVERQQIIIYNQREAAIAQQQINMGHHTVLIPQDMEIVHHPGNVGYVVRPTPPENNHIKNLFNKLKSLLP